MGLDFNFTGDQTPLEEEEKEGLLISTISTRADLNEFEQLNVEDAMQWALGKSFNTQDIFCEKFVCDLHQRMFGNVWSWAGKYRQTEKNLGINRFKIATSLKVLCDDALYWVENTSYTPIEIAIRFKHRMVSIHCFANGNGRHSRLMADIIIQNLSGKLIFTWGSKNLTQQHAIRPMYLKAIKAADKGDYSSLIAFAQS